MGFLVSPPTSTSQKPAAGPAFLISGCGNFVLLVIQAQNLRSTSSLRFLSHTTSNWSASPTDVNRSRIYPSPLLRLRSNPLLTVPHEWASSGCYNGVPQTGCHKPGGLSNGSLWSHTSGSWMLKVKVLTGLVPSEGCWGWMGFRPLSLARRWPCALCISLHHLSSTCISFQIPLFIETPVPLDEGNLSGIALT